MSTYVVIPARHASTRLPGKVLRLLAGRTMLQHVYERARASGISNIIIATDDDRIARVANEFGADVCMTSPEHISGTHRISEVISKRNIPHDAILVNLQGDEPLMPASCVAQVAELLQRNSDADVATLSMPVYDEAAMQNPNIVKVVTNRRGYANYFSRACIPYQRDKSVEQLSRALQAGVYQRHIGIYAYRAGYVLKYVNLDASPYEELEKLEQLRVLWHDGRIIVAEAVQLPGPGVDTEEELQTVELLLKSNQASL